MSDDDDGSATPDGGGSAMSDDDGSATPDDEALAEMRALVDDLAATAAELRALGAREDVPAVERNAARLQGVVEQLDRNLPPELLEGE